MMSYATGDDSSVVNALLIGESEDEEGDLKSYRHDQ